jgi:hypothetical protein
MPPSQGVGTEGCHGVWSENGNQERPCALGVLGILTFYVVRIYSALVKPFLLNMPEWLYEAIKAAAQANQRSMTAEIRLVLERAFGKAK